MANSRNEDIEKERMAGSYFGKSQALSPVALHITLSLYSKCNIYFFNIASVCSPVLGSTDSTFNYFATDIIQW